MALELEARRGDAITGIILAAAGVGLACLSWPIPLGEVENPGPGFAPFALGLTLAGLGVLCAVRAWRSNEHGRVVLGEANALLCIGALFAAVLLWERIGFISISGVVLAVLFAVLAPLPWWKAGLAGFAAAIVLWAVFVKALGVALPGGFLSF